MRGEGECWPWLAFRNPKGYGLFGVGEWVNGNPRPVLAHRFAYVLLVGPIPEGRYVCHACDNPACVNPAHLWVGSAADNARDAASKGRLGGPRPERRGVKPKRKDGRPVGAKLSLEDVRAIRADPRAASKRDGREVVAEEYGVSSNQVRLIWSRKSWADYD